MELFKHLYPTQKLRSREIYELSYSFYLKYLYLNYLIPSDFNRLLKMGLFTHFKSILTLKRLGEVNLPPTPLVFPKMCFSEKGQHLSFLWLLILSEATSFLKVSLKFLNFGQKIKIFFSTILTIFINFSDFLTFPCYKEAKSNWSPCSPEKLTSKKCCLISTEWKVSKYGLISVRIQENTD